ncbi:MAG: hypothetical protein JWO33_273 [Caulobacteraceae bacterium]|nr:hypothetical protein [Caulobacteraceae bacterium]
MTDETIAGGAAGRPPLRLPGPRLGFPKQLEILRGFAALSGSGKTPVHYSKVAETIQAHESNVSTMNPFFVENGFILKAGQGHVPSDAVLEFARQWNWNQDTAAAALAPLLRQTWFGHVLSQRLMFRSLTEEEAIQVLAAYCGAGPVMKPQLRVLLDYLSTAGVVRRENGHLTHVADASGAVAAPPPPEQSSALVVSPSHDPAPKSGAGNISLQVNVDVSMTDLAGWSADRITAFFAGMAQVIAAQNAEKSKGPTG